MMSTDSFESLVQPGRVHRRLYTDPAIFELEMERIFGNAWIYVGHESQIKNIGDYVRTFIGGKPIVLVRDSDGHPVPGARVTFAGSGGSADATFAGGGVVTTDSNGLASVQATAETEGAKQAVLRYRKLAALAGGALLEFRPETGRMHQLRVQAAIHGWPILGDERYGARAAFGPPALLARDRVIGLHGRSLTFLHPVRYEPITVTAPLPDAWRSLSIPADIYNWDAVMPCADDSLSQQPPAH